MQDHLEDLDFESIYKKLRSLFHHKTDLAVKRSTIIEYLYESFHRESANKYADIDKAEEIFCILEKSNMLIKENGPEWSDHDMYLLRRMRN